MKLPHYTEYQSAVQYPKLAFKADPDLRVCQVETDPLGRPRVRSGNFAYTYRLDGADRQWAVRCFSKYVPEQHRYEAISRFISTHPTVFFVPTAYLSQGILVSGQWYPVVKMQWKQGQTLGAFIERHIDNPQAINDVLVQFQNLAATLERLGIAHGDLQHGNIIVSNGRLFLVDYDGMFVPGLDGSEAKERGHPNYQHPVRWYRDFGPYLDRFSVIVIYLALKGLAVNPGLWDKYSTGENLLFRQKDFLSPDTSPLLSDLEVTPTMRPLVERFRATCKVNIAQVPTLADFLSGKIPGILLEGAVTATKWGQYEIVVAEERLRLLGFVGERVTVIGKISEYYQDVTKYNKPYVFLSFGDWRHGGFRLVVWSEALELFQSKGKDLRSYEGAWVSVTGLLTEYQKEDFPKRPQIEIESPAEIEVLAGPDEAKQRLPGQKPPGPPPPIPPGNLELAREHFLRARNYDQEGRLDKAIKEYQAALRINPSFADARNNLGWIYERQGRLDEAVAEYETAIQLDSNSIVKYRNLGRVYGKKKRFDEAIKSLLAALEIDPKDASTHFQLGWVYGEKGRLDKAITEYQAALQVNPKLDGAYVNMGWAYSRQGRHDDALREYRNAIQINPENGLAHFNLGCLYRIKGQTEDARRELELALKLGYEPARKMLQEIKGAK